MAVAGSPDPWAPTFPYGLVPRILELVIAAWAGLPKPSSQELEPRITRSLRDALRQTKNATRDLPCLIDREVVEDDAASGAEKGRIDIRFIHGYDEAVYFAFECKRLNVATPNGGCRALAREYVEEGMMRFVIGKYAAGLEHGGMIGFVMDGNSAAATARVDVEVKARTLPLRMTPGTGLAISALLPAESAVRETRHPCRPSSLTLHHVFLAV
jgi:hypothetical protein